MKVKFVIEMELDDTIAIDDDTGERLPVSKLNAILSECLSDGDFPIEIDEIKEISVY